MFKHKKKECAENFEENEFPFNVREKKMKNSFKTIFSAPLALIVNLLLIYVSFSLCRLLFIWVNHNYLPI